MCGVAGSLRSQLRTLLSQDSIEAHLEVLSSERHGVDLVLVQELLINSEARGVLNDLGDRFARLDFCATLVVGHDRRTLVVGAVLVSANAHEEAVAVAQRSLEQVLVANVAQVVHTVAVDVDANREEGHVGMVAQVAEDCDVVYGNHSKDNGMG